MSQIIRYEITTDRESLADIDPQYYHDMVEALISDHFGGEYEYSFRLDNHSRIRVELADPNEREEPVEEFIRRLCEDAFERCCREDAVPSV